GAPCGSHLHSLSFRVRVLHPNTRIDVRLLGPCFKTGHLRPLCQHPRKSADLSRVRWYYTEVYNTLRGEPHSNCLYPTNTTDAGPPTEKCTTQKDSRLTASESGSKIFSFNNFTYYLTLCSELFSSFDLSTCALSVSCQYLALDGVYHPFRAAFPNNSTR